MTMAAEPIVVEELLAKGDDGRCGLIAGEIISMPHAGTAIQLYQRLRHGRAIGT